VSFIDLSRYNDTITQCIRYSSWNEYWLFLRVFIRVDLHFGLLFSFFFQVKRQVSLVMCPGYSFSFSPVCEVSRYYIENWSLFNLSC
jgi:hypothetical protein